MTTITSWEKAEEKVQEIVESFKKVCAEYNLEITDISNQNPINGFKAIRIKTIINAHNNSFNFDWIHIEYGISFNNRFIIDFWFDSNNFKSQAEYSWNYYRFEHDCQSYDVILKFFKDNNVLTKDEMIIKDIIE